MHRFSNFINPVNLNNPFIQINLISASARSMQLNPILTNFTVTRLSVISPPEGHLLKPHLRNGHGNPRAALRRRRLPRANLAGQARRQGTSMILIGRLSSAQSISRVLLKNKLNLKMSRSSNFPSGARTLWQLPCWHNLQGQFGEKTRKGAPEWRSCNRHNQK